MWQLYSSNCMRDSPTRAVHVPRGLTSLPLLSATASSMADT